MVVIAILIIWNLSNTVSMIKKNIPESISMLTNLWFKRTKTFVAIRSEMKSTEWNKKKKCPESTIISIVCNGETTVQFVVQLCRQNDYSDNFKFFSSFESSIKAFDNIFGNDFCLTNTVLLKFLIVCIQAGSVGIGWKFAVVKWTELAL